MIISFHYTCRDGGRSQLVNLWTEIHRLRRLIVSRKDAEVAKENNAQGENKIRGCGREAEILYPAETQRRGEQSKMISRKGCKRELMALLISSLEFGMSAEHPVG